MKQRISAALALAALFASTMPAAAAPLAPTGKWGLDQQKDRCVLQHAFGTPGAERTLAILPHPGRATEFLLILPKEARIKDGAGQGRIALQPSARNLTATVQTVTLDTGSSASRLSVDEAVLDALPKTSQLDLVVTGAADLSFTLPPMAAPAAALEACQQQMAQLLGVDPAIPRHHPSARGDGRGRQRTVDVRRPDGHVPKGRTLVLLIIGADGAVAECRTAESSGDTETDAGACEIARKIQYRPERDEAGKPVRSWTMFEMNWPG